LFEGIRPLMRGGFALITGVGLSGMALT